MSSLKSKGHFLGATHGEASSANKQHIWFEVKEKKMHGEKRCIQMQSQRKTDGEGNFNYRLSPRSFFQFYIKAWLQFLLLASDRWPFSSAQIS